MPEIFNGINPGFQLDKQGIIFSNITPSPKTIPNNLHKRTYNYLK